MNLASAIPKKGRTDRILEEMRNQLTISLSEDLGAFINRPNTKEIRGQMCETISQRLSLSLEEV